MGLTVALYIYMYIKTHIYNNRTIYDKYINKLNKYDFMNKYDHSLILTHVLCAI